MTGADLYMYGHYYACDNCLAAMRDNHIAAYYVVEGAEQRFKLGAQTL